MQGFIGYLLNHNIKSTVFSPLCSTTCIGKIIFSITKLHTIYRTFSKGENMTDNNRINRRKITGGGRGSNPLVLIFGIAIILACIYTIYSQYTNTKTLEVYSESNRVEEEEIAETVDTDIETEIYTDSENNLSIAIPVGWQQVTKDGYPTFVHSESASSLQIQVMDYDPEINNITEDSISLTVADNGYTFISYSRLDNSSYELLYQDYQNSIYDYIEYVTWDRNKIVKLYCVFNDENYTKIIPYYENSINSFAWSKESEIPEGYYIFYDAYDEFEVGMPSDWNVGTADYAIVSMDPNSNASLTITMSGYTGTVSDMGSVDVSSVTSSGKNNYIMQSFDAYGENGVVRATYVVDNVQMQNVTYIDTDGVNIYFLDFTYEYGSIDEALPEICAGMFRSFVDEDSSEKTEDTDDLENDTKQDDGYDGAPDDPSLNNKVENTVSDEENTEEAYMQDGYNDDKIISEDDELVNKSQKSQE